MERRSLIKPQSSVEGATSTEGALRGRLHPASPVEGATRAPVIDPMQERDLPEVLAIEQVSFPTPFSEVLFRTELQLEIAHLYVARAESRIVGYIDFWHVISEIHLINIAVHPHEKKKGIGSLLMESMIHYAHRQQAERLLLDVRASNASGLILYKKFGFSLLAIREGYYRDNQEDAWVMELSLKNVPAANA